MNRSYQDSSSMCCCGRNEHVNGPKSSCVHQTDSSTSEDENDYVNYSLSKYDNSCKNNQPHNFCNAFENQSWKIPSTSRGKSHQYSRSEMEEATAVEPFCSHRIYPNENQFGNASLLRRANDLIDYMPESEFLKKIKQQCQYLQNSQSNIFFSVDDFIESDFSPYECQKCEVSSNPVKRHTQQLHSDRIKSASERSEKCTCNQQSNMNRTNDDQVPEKTFANAQRLCKEFLTENQPKGKKQTNGKSKKKSEHVSRSKKPHQCSGRRKRKSVSIEKCELNDQFEPSLKKPHENSCERCWRFASPSRSPVNKPDQKFDPNFRRGHSYTDLEKGDGNIVDRESQFENFEPSICRAEERSPSPFCCGQHIARSPPISVKEQDSIFQPSLCTSTKVKELLKEQSFRKPLENYLPTARTADNSQLYKTESPECHRSLLSASKEKPRPKSYTPGLSFSPQRGKCPKDISDLDTTDYKTICMNPRKHFSDTPNTSKSLRTPATPTVPSTFNESHGTYSRGGSPNRSFDHSGLKPIPEVVVESSKESKRDVSKKLEERETPKSKLQKTQSEGKNLKASTPKAKSENKNLKASSPKKPASGVLKPKGIQKPASSKAKNVQLETKTQKTSPNISKSQTNFDKYKCSQEVVENICADKEKPQAATNSGARECRYKSNPSCGNTADHQKDFHPIRDCSCYPRIPRSKNDTDNQNGHIFCCHCDWGESHKNQTNSHPLKSSFNIHRNHDEDVSFYRKPNAESNERRFIKDSDNKSCSCSRKTRKTPSPENSLLQSSGTNADFSERTLPCPYRNYMNKNMISNFSNSPESGGSPTWEEYQSSREHQKACENKELFSKCSPRKYFVFYMAKSKKHKKGDDVEVLVEEFAQSCADAKDTRTKDIAEKMKKILECPSDSMALRFQKGVSETCKTPPSSRILYF